MSFQLLFKLLNEVMKCRSSLVCGSQVSEGDSTRSELCSHFGMVLSSSDLSLLAGSTWHAPKVLRSRS